MITWLVLAAVAAGLVGFAISYCRWRDRQERSAFEASLTPFERQRFKSYSSDWRDYIPLVAAERETSLVARLSAERDARTRRDLQLS